MNFLKTFPGRRRERGSRRNRAPLCTMITFSSGRQQRQQQHDRKDHAAHGDAHIGLFQCRRVIDAVADHAHALSARLIISDVPQLILRQAIGVNIPDPQLAADGTRRFFVVAGQEHRLYA